MVAENDLYLARQQRGCIFGFITALARIAGLVTVAGLWTVTYFEWSENSVSAFQLYITFVTIVVSYLELLWLFDKCINCCLCCFGSELCFRWICCVPIDNWIKALLYTVFTVPVFLLTWNVLWLSTDIMIVVGMLWVTSVLYLLKTFKYKAIPADSLSHDEVFDGSFASLHRPSVYTQTSVGGINKDNSSSVFILEQDGNNKP